MIEHYGKVVALDGSEYVYTDFKDSRKKAVALAEARDQADPRRARTAKGSAADDPRAVGAGEAGGNPAAASQSRTPASPHPAMH